jgi:hypothetical protein
MDRFNQSPTSRKDILVYPLARHWRHILHRVGPAPQPSTVFSDQEDIRDDSSVDL